MNTRRVVIFIRNVKTIVLVLSLSLSVLQISGCGGVYYDTMEQFGVHKRDILVDRVEDARDAQEEAKEQFSSALAEFSSVLEFDGGDLQETYDALNEEFEESEERANEVNDRIEGVESVSTALFDEWQEELELYSNQSLRQSSADSLKATQERYQQLISAMHSSESKMTPVIDAFRDQVLFLKHNLNSRAIASLKTELANIENDIADLILDMEVSIAESNSFLADLELI